MNLYNSGRVDNATLVDQTRKTVKNIFMFGTKLGVAFHSKVRFAFKSKCLGYAFKYGLKGI